MKKGLLVFTCLLLASAASAHQNGFVNQDGYVFSNGNWLWPATGQLYSLSTYLARPACNTCGHYSAAVYGNQYTLIQAAVVPYVAPATPPAYSSNWKSDVIKFAEAKDDREAYFKALDALGVHYSGSSYGYGAQLFGANATTPYGYSFNTLAQVYGDTNLTQLYQQSAQLTQGAQKLAGDANLGHQALVGQAGSNASRVAEILAKGQAGSQIVKSFQGPSTLQTQTTITGQQTLQTVQQPSAAPRGDMAALQLVIGAKCAACHSQAPGASVKGGLNLADWPNFDQGRKDQIIDRLTTSDPAKFMPRSPTGGPGARLTVPELREFTKN